MYSLSPTWYPVNGVHDNSLYIYKNKSKLFSSLLQYVVADGAPWCTYKYQH